MFSPHIEKQLGAYAHQPAQFQSLLTGQPHSYPGIAVERVITSPGTNTSLVPMLVFGVHLGNPVTIHRRREKAHLTSRVTQGQIIFTPAGEPLTYAHTDSVDAIYLSIDAETLHTVSAQLGIGGNIRFQEHWALRDMAIERIAREFAHEFSHPALGEHLYTEGLTLQLLVHLLRHYTLDTSAIAPPDSHQPADGRLRAAEDYIRARLYEPITVAEIAQSVHLTPYYFSRLFKQTHGVAPHQYILRERVKAAQQLLRDPKLTVSEIAALVGFSDHSHFVRHYKRLTGTPPRGSAKTSTE